MAEQQRRDGSSAGSEPEQPSGRADENRSGETPADQLSALRAELEQERERAETNHANWQRAVADFINYKRRVEQEREESARFANLALVLNVLPSVDDLERALQHVEPEFADRSWVEGVRQILRKLTGALTAAGVSEVAAEGEMFDPNQHEAIAEGDGEAGRVVSVAQRGYRLGNRVIRPAMVVVGCGNGTETKAAGNGK